MQINEFLIQLKISNNMKSFIIQWNHLTCWDDFYNQIEWLFLQNSDIIFWRNLDALSDVLYWWFGSFDEQEEIEIIWKDFEISRNFLKEIDIIEEIILEYKHIKFRKM